MAATSETETTRASAASETGQHGFGTQFQRENADTGAEEAHTASVVDQTRSWNLNSKALFDDLVKTLSEHDNEGASHTGNNNTIREQLLANMVTNANLADKAYLRHLSLQDRSVFTAENELEANLAAKSGIQADALAALIVKAVGDAVNAVKK